MVVATGVEGGRGQWVLRVVVATEVAAARVVVAGLAGAQGSPLVASAAAVTGAEGGGGMLVLRVVVATGVEGGRGQWVLRVVVATEVAAARVVVAGLAGAQGSPLVASAAAVRAAEVQMVEAVMAVVVGMAKERAEALRQPQLRWRPG